MGWKDWLFPRRCVGCRAWGSYVCAACVNKLVVVEEQVCPMCERPAVYGMTHERCKKVWGMDGLTGVVLHKGVARRMITSVKYSLVSDMVDELVEVVVSLGDLQVLARGEWVVVPVPLHKRRERWRGFNQAVEIGKRLSYELGFAYGELLERTRYTQPQMELSRKKRLQNLRGAFSLSSKGGVKDKQILLVDDVWTTGATMRECAKVLKRQGAAKVWGLVVARA